MDKVLLRCDKVIAFCLYASIFFLPIASAITEGLFAIIILSYLIKRGIIFYDNFKEIDPKEKNDLYRIFGVFFNSYKPVSNALNISLSIYLLIAFLSVILSNYLMTSFKGFFFKLLQGAFTFFLFVEVINSKKRLKIFLSIFLFSITLISVNGIYQYFVRAEFIHYYPITDGRVTSSFKHANDLGGYLVMILPMLFCLSAYFKGPLSSLVQGHNVREKFTDIRFRILIVALFFLSVFCLGLTYSRGAWLGLVVSMIFLSWKRPKIFFALIVGLLIFLSVFFVKMRNERTTNIIGNLGAFSSSSRFLYWKSALKVMDTNPVLGVGFNAYSEAAKDYPGQLYWRGYPHNCYLHIAAETGVVGLAAFLCLLYNLFRHSLKKLKEMRDRFGFNLLLGLLAGFLGFLVHSFFDTSFYSVQLDTLMWLMLGFIVSVPSIYAYDKPNK